MEKSVDVLAYLQDKGILIKGQHGDEVNVPCVFHGEDSSARGRLYINVSNDEALAGLHHCKVCDERGNLVTLMRHFGDELYSKDDDTTNPAKVNAVYQDACEYYQSNLDIEHFKWLKEERGLTPETIKRHRLGWADGNLYVHLREKGHRLKDMLATGLIKLGDAKKFDDPLKEDEFILESTGSPRDFLYNEIAIPYIVSGNVVQIRGKQMGGKYRTPPKQKARLFNSDSTWDADEVVLCEGEFDAMVAEQMGYRAVGLPGASSWQDSWMGYLDQARRVYIIFDNDKAGNDAAEKMKERLGENTARIVKMPDNDLPPGENDISEMFGRQKHTKEEFDALIRQVRSGMLISVYEAFEEWCAVQNEDGFKLGMEQLDFLLKPGIFPGSVMVPLAKTNTGKSNVNSEIVPTPSGFRRWGDLAVGDQVFGSDGKPTEVIGVYDRGVMDSYRVTFSDGTSVLTGLDHVWTVEYRYGKFRDWKRENLTTEHLLNESLKVGSTKEWKYIIPMVAPIEYPEIGTSVDPYTLGALIANGSMTTGSVRLSTPDGEVVKRMREAHVANLHASPEDACPRYGLPGMIGKIRDLGLDVHSRDKFIPEPYLLGSIDQRIALLQGLMDGDGGASGHYGRAVRYFTTSRRLAEDVVCLVNSLGGTATPKWQDRGAKGIECSINIMLPEGVEPFSTSRKQRGDSRYNTVPRRAIVSVEREGQDEHRCIRVAAEDSLYCITRNYVVTHNTLAMLNLFQSAVMANPDPRFLFCSLEQTRGEWFERARRIYSFHHPEIPLSEVDRAALDFWSNHIMLTDRNRMTKDDLIGAIEDYEYEMGGVPQFVAIDYLGYFARSSAGASPYERMTNAIMDLKEVAKEKRVIICAPGQFSRGVEFGVEPDLDKARESGAIEETADFAFGLWNEDTRKGVEPSDRKGVLNWRILKSRQGGKGHKVEVQFGYCTLAMLPVVDPRSVFLRDELEYSAQGEEWDQAMMRHKTGQKTGRAPSND